jgi:hypothetical protein
VYAARYFTLRKITDISARLRKSWLNARFRSSGRHTAIVPLLEYNILPDATSLLQYLSCSPTEVSCILVEFGAYVSQLFIRCARFTATHFIFYYLVPAHLFFFCGKLSLRTHNLKGGYAFEGGHYGKMKFSNGDLNRDFDHCYNLSLCSEDSQL